jgi:hypothetical protein
MTTIINESKVPITSLNPKDIRISYQTHEPTISLNESFLEKFRVDSIDFKYLVKDWYTSQVRQVKEGERYILMKYLNILYMILNTMICILYGEETNTQFRMEWFMMAYTVVKTRHLFNWETILTYNIFNRAKEAQGIKRHGFLYVSIFD